MGSTPQGDSHASVRSFLLFIVCVHGLSPLKAIPM